MLLRVQFVEESLAEIGRIVADSLQEIQIFRRDALQYLPHPCHRKLRQPVADSAGIDAVDEVFHQFAALGFAHFGLSLP